MSIISRIQILENQAKSDGIKSFSKFLGIPPSSLSSAYTRLKVKPEKATIGANVIEKILLKYEKLNPKWLILGKGEMWIDQKNEVNEPDEKYGNDINMINWIRELEARIIRLESNIK